VSRLRRSLKQAGFVRLSACRTNVFLIFVPSSFVITSERKGLDFDVFLARSVPAPFAGEGLVVRIFANMV
jgi:hypothetical protein